MGVASIRAYRQQERFRLESERRVDYNQMAYYPTVCSDRYSRPSLIRLPASLLGLSDLLVFKANTAHEKERNIAQAMNDEKGFSRNY